MRRILAGLLLGMAPLLCGPEVRAQEERCGTVSERPVPHSSGTGGVHLTSSGTLRVLIVFASFRDDETPHPYWPAHQPPLFLSQFIDPDTSTRTQTPFNLTRYFREMSLGQFHLIGEAIWLESWQSKTAFVNNGSYGLANTNALHEVDPVVDFSLYDNWTNAGDRQNLNVPDSIVDMVIMVWRTTVFQLIGEASLGYKPGILLDGKWVEMGYPERYDLPRGSGVTCEYPYGDDPERVMRTMAHEVGHWLLGGPHPYNAGSTGGKSQFWSILCAGERFSSCANAYDREQLGWITVPELPSDTLISLADFVTTGTAVKLSVPSGEPDESFYIENHQLLTPFDDVTRNRSDRGIWILHRIGPYAELDRLRIMPSDGGWVWDAPATTTACYGQELPLFEKVTPSVPFGLTHRDQIPTASSSVNWINAYREGNEVRCGAAAAGEGFAGAFTPGIAAVFSPFSNPSSHAWSGSPTGLSLEVLTDSSGILTLRRARDPVLLSPARRHLGFDPTAENVGPTELPLAWGGEWREGQPLEPDVNWSECQRKVGETGEWTTVYEGPSTTWRESSVAYVPGGTIPVKYRARVRDTSGLFSAWSPLFTSATTGADDVPGRDLTPGQAVLEQSYPNPFNGSAVMTYRLPGRSMIDLRVFDLLGRVVMTLEEGWRDAGTHSVRLSAAGLASGSYIVRLRTSDGVTCRRVLLLR